MDSPLTDLEETVGAYQFNSYGGEQYDRQGYHNLLKTISFWRFSRLTLAWNDPYLSVPNRKVVREKKIENREMVREKKMKWVIPRSLFLRNRLHTEHKTTVGTYDFRFYGGEELDRQRDPNLPFRLTLAWNDP